MASAEHLLISKIIAEGDFNAANQAGVRSFHFNGDWAKMFEWVSDYVTVHGQTPSDRAFAKQFGDVEILDASKEPFTGLFEELMDEYRIRTIGGAITDAMAPLNKGEADKASEVLQKGLQAASRQTTRLRDFDIIQNWQERLADYRRRMENPDELLGIPTGFNGLDKVTQGFRPQQWVVMVGEQKRGKSLFELIMARSAHRHGYHPLFVSYEMSVAEQSSRFDALEAKVPYERILDGTLTEHELEKLEKSMMLNKSMQPFLMSEDTSGLTTVSALSSKIMEYKPDILFVDGIYLMDDDEGEDKGSPQALTNISRGFKRMAQRFQIPIVGTSQVLSWKINNKKSRAITADSIGYTSAFAQDADLILGVERHPDLDNQAIIRIVESRTTKRCAFDIKWDFQTMEFEELDYFDPEDRVSYD